MLPEFSVTVSRNLSRAERERVASAGLRAAYIGHDLPVQDAIPVITLSASSERDARDRLARLLGLGERDAERLIVSRLASADANRKD